MSGFASGAKTYFTDSADHILDLRNGLDFLSPSQDGVALVKLLGTNAFNAKSPKIEWNETSLAVRKETITLADGTGTALTVANAYQYQVNELLRVEAEVLRVTGITNATTLAVARGAAGTTGAAHASKVMRTIGSADPENSLAPAGITDTVDRLYNYVQTFTRAVELSNDEIAQATSDLPNAFAGNLKRRFIEINRQLATAILYGVRYEDSANKIHMMGGLKQFVQTNVTNVGGALSISAIDAKILAQVQAGADPTHIAVSPYQKQKLDALDSNKIYTGKRELAMGGNPVVSTWQSGVLDHTLDVIVDHGINDDELWILDKKHVEIGSLSNNGVDGAFHVEDATTPGQDGKKSVIRGKYTMRVGQEKAHSYLYGLS
jgi:hypothetical protein